MIGFLVWNHWFWITLIAVSRCSCDSLLIQPYRVPPAPLLQSFAMGDLVREEDEGETDDVGEPFIVSDVERNVMVSKSVSVSRVSVEIGGVRVEKKTDNKLPSDDVISEKFPISRNTLKPESVFQTLLDQLKSVGSNGIGGSKADLFSDPPADEYQLVYRDEEYAEEDTDTTYEEEEYLNYLYDVYDEISDVYGESIFISDKHQENAHDLQSNSIAVKSEQYNSVINYQSSKSLDNLGTVSQQSDLVKSRSDQILHEADIKYFSEDKEEISEDALKTENTIKVYSIEEIVTNDKDHNFDREISIDFSSSKAIAINIKISIFVSVVIGVTITAVVAVFVTRRKVRSAKVVTDEDQSTMDSQFAFSRGLKNEDSLCQENFNTSFGKSSYLGCEDLHSLDNDSFLTSLETIQHGKDRRNVLLL